jgi:hypothetical protein
MGFDLHLIKQSCIFQMLLWPTTATKTMHYSEHFQLFGGPGELSIIVEIL